MASDLSSGCMETIDVLDDEKEEGEISLEDVSSSEEGGMGHLTCGYVVNRTRKCSDCKSWPKCASWCTIYHSKSKKDPVKGKENQRVKEAGCTVTKHAAPAPQEKNDDLVPISSDSDLEIVGLTDTSNRSKARIKKKKRKKDYKDLTIDDLISPQSPSIDLHVKDFNKLTLYREVSPVHKNNRLKVILPVRKHRSPIKTRSPLKDYSPIHKKSPRRLRSPKRNPLYRSPTRIPRKPSRQDSPARKIRSHVNKHDDVTRLLKRVKRLDSTHSPESNANRGKVHQSSSLMDKLTNMFKRTPDNDRNNTTHLKMKSKCQSESVNRDEADDEDLALLRQKALETKQKKFNRPLDHLADMEMDKESIDAKNDDQDEEALQLRMIALRSAIMKKHQNRVQRGIRARRTTRSESPFSQSFLLEDVPAPSNELLQFASPPCTPPQNNNHTEDMELDTDVEREKERLPYSPTDKIVPIDAAMLGIEPSDVSFINVNETNKSPIFNDTRQNDDVLLSTDISSYYNEFVDPKPPDNYCYSSSRNDSVIIPTGINNLINNPKHFHNNMCDLIDGICCRGNETHHLSITDNAHADTTCAFPEDKNFPPRTSIISDNISVSPQTHQMMQPPASTVLFANADSVFRNDKHTYETHTFSGHSMKSSTTFAAGYTELISSNGSTIYNFPRETETGIELSLAGGSKCVPIKDYIPKPTTSCQIVAEEEKVSDMPDDVKTSNKIPTLINRKPVHVQDLKLNKQPLLSLSMTKTSETQEIFQNVKSVTVSTDVKKDNVVSVKSVKLQPTKKPTSVLLTPVVASDTSMDETSLNVSEDRSESLASIRNKREANKLEYLANVDKTRVSSENNSEISSERKVRKRVKKNLKNIELTGKNIDTTTQLHKKHKKNSDNDANKNVNITNASDLEPQTVEFDKDENNDNNKLQEKNRNEELSKNREGVVETEKNLSDNYSGIEVQNKDAKNNNYTFPMNEEEQKKDTREKNIQSYCSSTSNTSDVETTTDVNDRKSSVDENDENALRAILLASLKRTKPTNNANVISIAPTINTTVCGATNNVQAPMQKLTSPVVSSAISTTNNASLSSVSLSTSETNKKKLNNVSTSVLQKRSSSVITKGPLKKMIKKTPTPASTKVLNNAKKYQNMIVQRKLNLRKLDNVRNSAKSNEWPKTLHGSDAQRFVISLGSDTDSESESEKRKTVLPKGECLVQDDFEKSVQKFLRDMRKEQEQSAAAAAKPASSSPLSPQVAKRDASPVSIQIEADKNSTNMHTPLAVRHLPISQQEEYRRLKQQILEREKLKLQRTIATDEKTTMHVKQNQIKLKELEMDNQPMDTTKKKNIDVVSQNVTLSNASRIVATKSHRAENIIKHTNSIYQAKEIKKTIQPTNFSVRITNEIAPNHNAVESKPIDNSKNEKQSDKQHHRPALRVLNKDKINQKNVQVMLKVDKIGRVVTLSDNKLSLLHDTPGTSQSEKSIENNVGTESLNEKDKTNENNSNNSVFANASTVNLSDLSVSSNEKKQELDNTLVTTMSHFQYEAECQREINRNSSAALPVLETNVNNFSRLSEINDKGDSTDDEVLKKDTETEAELNTLANLSEAEQQQYLRDSEHKLVAKRYNVLDHLAEMSGNLRQWDMEKDLQSSLAAEVKKLKDQLKMAEKKLQQQRDRVNNMGLKVSSARQKINNGRQEYFKLSKICLALGNRLLGKNYRLPEAGDQLLSDKFKEVAGHARQFTKKKRSQFNETVSENCNSNLSQQTSAILEESKVTVTAEENLSQKQLADAEGLKNNTSNLKQSNELETIHNENENENLLISELSLNLSQIFSNNQITSEKRKETSTNVSGSRGNEQISFFKENNMLSSATNLSSIEESPIEESREHLQKTQSVDISDDITTSELEISATDCSLHQNDEQSNDGTDSLSPLPAQTTSTTKTSAITPYVSILAHLKMPRNTNPHGVLCPFEIMGVCRDEDCEYIHQSRNQA
ncbi:uncharacterized protein LOC109859405 isoform X2 [Pseudomyrmex gracilis]|uniref:uncharacterized protein LOC109859405 isoform X2 n=1 Tax=Pseudomyrmex gracilis TaxID=219809 RepID=UPI0009956346|nr:uncharacterized protein LOC109859405 isoform X2 [Pseudomyrmex gracilis]